MPFEQYQDPKPGPPDIAGSLAGLAVAIAGIPVALMSSGLGIATRLFAGPARGQCSCGTMRIEYRCDGSIVRHHYRYSCVPHCYGCGGGCS